MERILLASILVWFQVDIIIISPSFKYWLSFSMPSFIYANTLKINANIWLPDVNSSLEKSPKEELIIDIWGNFFIKEKNSCCI